MHHHDILAIRLGVNVASVAQEHHLAAATLLDYLKQLFPSVDVCVLERAATIGAALPPGGETGDCGTLAFSHGKVIADMTV